ncbi:hypothetical protein VPHD484_0234 [Vibrio phage D484]
MKSYAVKFKSGGYVHENWDYQIGSLRYEGNHTDDINKAKLWKKLGMVQNFMRNNGRFYSSRGEYVIVVIEQKRVEMGAMG